MCRAMVRHGLRLAILALMAGAGHDVEAQTRIHRDWGGVTTWVGRVRISTRRSGHTMTTIRVGNNNFHDSNFGLSGISYTGTAGRVDVLSAPRFGSQARYRPDWTFRPPRPLYAAGSFASPTWPTWPSVRRSEHAPTTPVGSEFPGWYRW